MDIREFTTMEKRPSSVEMVIDTIKTMLRNKTLKAGDKLPSEHVLADKLATSRGPIREAMKILSAYGIVDIRPGDGTYISTAANTKLFEPLLLSLLIMRGTNDDIRELIEIRELLEINIATLVIKNANDTDINKLKSIHQKMVNERIEHGDDHEALSRCDIDFHLAMCSIANNSLLEKIYSFIVDIFRPTINGLYALEPHDHILYALIHRDIEQAKLAIREHTQIWSKLCSKYADC